MEKCPTCKQELPKQTVVEEMTDIYIKVYESSDSFTLSYRDARMAGISAVLKALREKVIVMPTPGFVKESGEVLFKPDVLKLLGGE